jgi:hypothetical protein
VKVVDNVQYRVALLWSLVGKLEKVKDFGSVSTAAGVWDCRCYLS